MPEVKYHCITPLVETYIGRTLLGNMDVFGDFK